jgi:hypothetical protein
MVSTCVKRHEMRFVDWLCHHVKNISQLNIIADDYYEDLALAAKDFLGGMRT